ncbi:MAG: glycoside hydrolase family 88 protein [Clostridium sp.]|nr:glycoside hydrolase family 88 protein [Clostridium sp.]
MQEKEPAKVKMISAGRAEMIVAACEDILSYGVWDGKTRVKKWVRKYVLRQQTAPQDLIFWPTGLLAAGLWHCRQELLAAETDTFLLQSIEASLAAYFERWNKKKHPLFYLDDLLAGEVFLAIYEEYEKGGKENGIINAQNKEQYRAAIEKMAEYAFSYPTDEIGSFPYRANQKNGHIFVDSIGLTSPFLYEYGSFYGKDEGMELAVKQVANVLAYGIDAATGLPYHGYDMTTGDKYGIIGWGRAVGWLLRGMLGCMTTVYGAERLRESYSELIDASLIWQRKDGYFSWQLQAVEGPVDTSATAMICLALQEGLKTRMLQGENYREALDKGVRALQKSTRNGRIYDCLGECEGFARYPQDYGAYPWSLGVALLLDDMAGS